MLLSMQKDFREIAHCGGRVIVTTKTGEHGERLINTGFTMRAPDPQLGSAFTSFRNLGSPLGRFAISA